MKHTHMVTMMLIACPAFAIAQQSGTTEQKLPVISINKKAAEVRAALEELSAHGIAISGTHLTLGDGRELSESIQELRRVQQTAAFAIDGRFQQWWQEDPADSLYRVAHRYFSRQEYRPAAQRYAQLRTQFPNSKYYCDAAYYEAFSRYRLGTPEELRSAYTVLDGMNARCANASRRQDVPELTARVNSALARLGDSNASDRLRKAADDANVCDREERNVKIEALTALARLDPTAANPVLRQVLENRDACSAPIRRQVISLISRRNDPASVAQLVQVARTDPDADTRAEAVRALGRMDDDAALTALEEFLRTSTDSRLQREAAATLARSSNPRAQSAMRALIERRDVEERLRISAISGLGDRQALSTDAWKSMYDRVDTDELKQAVIYALAKTGTAEAQTSLLAIARNPAEPYAARLAAISRIRSTAPISDLYTLLQSADSRSMRLSIVSGLNARKEPEATDRLIEIAKTSTDPEVRSAAIRALTQNSRKDDPRVVKAIGEILGCCGT